MKAQNQAQKTIAQLFVGCFSIAIIGGALVQMAQAYTPPPDISAPTSSSGTGTRLFDSSCNADSGCGKCYVNGIKGKHVTDATGSPSCKICP